MSGMGCQVRHLESWQHVAREEGTLQNTQNNRLIDANSLLHDEILLKKEPLGDTLLLNGCAHGGIVKRSRRRCLAGNCLLTDWQQEGFQLGEVILSGWV